MLKILCVGPLWRGSNAGGLFKAISRQGHLVEIIDEFYEIPLNYRFFKTKVISRLSRRLFINEYNSKILEAYNTFNPDIILIYKGAFVLSNTLYKIKSSKVLLVNFYPDVSFHAHGGFLSKSLPLYDLIFTTKTFGIKDLDDQLGVKSSHFIPHGFDPDIHRPIDISKIKNNPYINDVSFIGTWSPQKEKYLKYVIDKLPQIDLKIFGSQWGKADDMVQSKWMNQEVLGDGYALAINSSKINLGLLSEKVKGASSGDQITSRTFHIPASRGFLLHEWTREVSDYFKEDQEIACFGDKEELIQKIQFYLDHEEEREKIRLAGYNRAVKDHSLDQRAIEIGKIINENMKLHGI